MFSLREQKIGEFRYQFIQQREYHRIAAEKILLLKEKISKQNDKIASLSEKLKELNEKLKELEGKTEV